MKNKAIGVFDSGIGGLTVYKALKEQLPAEKVIYLGDTARLPYGSKSAETIIKFSDGNALFLLTKNVKIIVVACNSSSSYAVPYLQDKFDIPVLGVIEPGAEAAVKHSKSKIGVIGTSATIKSGAYEKTIVEKKPGVKVISRDCPLFVPLVEEGWIDHKVTKLVVEEYLLPLKEQGIDTLVLGCTHYPVLKGVIAEVMGPGIELVDSAVTTAVKVRSILKSLGWLSGAQDGGEDEFYVTDFPDRFKRVGEIFLNKKIGKVTTATFYTVSLPQA
ncbi:MAG: glutamate racemase [Candidatus Aminicenantes bacterium]|nr:glutamate racemase [Candidatus Aminicenantes bacterium]